ncbi:MAG TPA: GspH/FimT family pseudopilin [Gammaproteobacteria bacterium]|nr:GspH/FimT family pseudopilin [Gammaproteobacteria bacterium]
MKKTSLQFATAGFTLLEIIIVIIVMAIIGVVAMPQWQHVTINVNYEARRLLNDIRYTQALSMNGGQRYRWVKLSATSYQILNQAGTAIVLPSGGTQLTLTSGISFGALTNLPNNLVVFDSFGTPYIDTAIPGTTLGSTGSITLTGGGQSRTIQITPQTGCAILA